MADTDVSVGAPTRLQEFLSFTSRHQRPSPRLGLGLGLGLEPGIDPKLRSDRYLGLGLVQDNGLGLVVGLGLGLGLMLG